MNARLVPLDDSPPIELENALTLVGRAEHCDARFDHKSVSKLHCLLVKTDGLVLVRDLGSLNGTRVNGTRIRRAALLPNDFLGIAAFRYRVLFGEVLETSVAPPPVPALVDPDGSGEHPEPPPAPALGAPVKRTQLPDHPAD